MSLVTYKTWLPQKFLTYHFFLHQNMLPEGHAHICILQSYSRTQRTPF